MFVSVMHMLQVRSFDFARVFSLNLCWLLSEFINKFIYGDQRSENSFVCCNLTRTASDQCILDFGGGFRGFLISLVFMEFYSLKLFRFGQHTSSEVCMDFELEISWHFHPLSKLNNRFRRELERITVMKPNRRRYGCCTCGPTDRKPCTNRTSTVLVVFRT